MKEILDRIVEGKGEEGDIEKLEDLCNAVKDGALCGLGNTAPNPVLTTIRYFRDEFEAHIYEHRCPAGECRALISYHIDPDKCIGCTACARQCPVNAIKGEVKGVHVVDNELCTKCGNCKTACKFDAVVVK
jgi:NADH-quinone oxidoreductase subunit F